MFHTHILLIPDTPTAPGQRAVAVHGDSAGGDHTPDDPLRADLTAHHHQAITGSSFILS